MTTAELVRVWKSYTQNNGDASIIRAIELELHFRPVRERIACGYPK